ncbi:MAG: hypothetical protein Q9166_004722 [cf. Caloplaca sp. 2 TL-2023]
MVDCSQGSPSLMRPPTPPKENAEEAAKLPIDHSYQGTLGQSILLNTPDESPSSSSDFFAGSSGTLPKRVVFSPYMSFHHPNDKASVFDVKIRSLPPSKECIALHKSILKASAEKNSPPYNFPQRLVLEPDQGITVMLHSVSQHLTKASRDARLDTYKSLIGCLSTYENIPDTQSLVDNVAGFLGFIRRDILAKQPGTENFDVELATTALKLFSIMLYTQGLVDAMPDDFHLFIAEQAVSSVERRDIPKIMIDHYMQILAKQKLPPRVITTDRANRILTALNGLEVRLKGNRVVGLKLMIYQRLLLQAKNLMVARVGEWLEFLTASMSSSIKDIRTRAVAFGTDAALALGTTAAVSQACLDLLNGELPSGEKVVEHLGSRMLELLNDKDGGIHVPQIWIVFILFLRSRRRQIERWEHLTSWLGIMQHSFNSNDAKVKRQANVTWNRLVSVIDLDASTNLSMVKMLRQPIATQLERKSTDKNLKHAKQIARSTYCNLLYFAFRPGASHEQLDLYWDNFVPPVLSIKASSTKSDQDFACGVLASILSAVQPRLWDQNRAHETSLLMKAEELPCLDPKWVRLRAAKVLSMLEKLLPHTKSDDIRDTPFFKAWQSFVKALGDAASKEVKASMETMAAFAQITSMLNRYWHHQNGTTEATLRRLEIFIALVSETAAKLGFRPFIEKRLLHDPSGDAFEAAETPSSRSSHPRRILNAPIIYMLNLIVNNSRGVEDSSTYKEAIHTLLQIALGSASGRRGHLTIVRQVAIDVLSGRAGAESSRLAFWNCLAKETERALSSPQINTPASDNPQRLSQDYRQSMAVLELGIREFQDGLYPSWGALSDAVVKEMEDEVGKAGVLLAYTEPLARVIHEEGSKTSSDTSLRCGSYLLNRARWPGSRQELDRARKQLWGPELMVSKAVSLDPFDHLYSMVETLLTSTYSNLHSASPNVAVDLITSTSSFLHSCPLSLKAVCLKRTQQGLALWIEDANAVWSHRDALSPSMRRLWKIVLDSLKSVAKPDSIFLGIVQDLVMAGFRSRHPTIVNDMITTWNQTFAKAESLEYPEPLRVVLTKLRPMVDIGLPSFVEDDDFDIDSSPFNFVESHGEDTDADAQIAALTTSRYLGPTAPPVSNRSSHSPAVGVRSSGTSASRRASRMTPRARLRHDYSQIQFAAIDSSPLAPVSDESQHLTDHQKEIKERQEYDAALMFRDIRSSPREPRSAERSLELVLHKKETLGKALDADAEQSPTFPPGDAIMHEFLGSSPTPRSSSKISVDRPLNDDPGSSPPSSPLPMFQELLLRARSSLESSKVTPAASKGSAQQQDPSHAANISSSVPSDTPNNATEYTADQTVIEAVTAQHSDQRSSGAYEHLVPELDTLVDTPEGPGAEKTDESAGKKDPTGQTILNGQNQAEPTTPRSNADNGSKAAHLDGADASSTQVSSHTQAPSTPTEDELVREQLLRDLAEASSQADKQLPKRRPSLSSPSKVSRKRKSPSNESTKPIKKAKLLPSSSQSVEVVVERRRPDQYSDKYIIVDNRPAMGTKRSGSLFIQQERASSPARTLQSSKPKKTTTHRRTRSMTDRNSLQSTEVEDAAAASASNTLLETNSDNAGTDLTGQHARKRRRLERYQEKGKSVEGNSPQDKALKQSITTRNQRHLPTDTGSAAHSTNPMVKGEDMSPSQTEGVKQIVLSTGDARPEAREAPSSSGGDTIPNLPCDNPPQSQVPGCAQTAARSPGQRMLDRLKNLLNDLRQVTLWPAEEREMMKVALEVVHEAGFGNGRHGQS